jgi:outer membrane murein-binding lipoprotein Lpp
MAGRRRKVSRIPAVAALVVLVVAGCGGGAPPQQTATAVRGIPSALAQDWSGQASAIADAAAAGNDCRAQLFALSLRKQVMQKQHLLPLRLRSPLVTGVDSLVERTSCRETVTVETTPAPPQHGPKPPHHPPPHGPKPPHGHGHGDSHGGDG